MIILIINALCSRPFRPVAGRLRVPLLNFGQPSKPVCVVKLLGIERAERITADALWVFQDQRQFRLQLHIRADKDVTQRPRIIEQMRRVMAVVTGAETDLIHRVFVARRAATDAKWGGNHWICFAHRTWADDGNNPDHPPAAAVAIAPLNRREKSRDDIRRR